LRALEQGATRKAACAIAMISQVMFNEWIIDDEQFGLQVEQAQAKFVADAARKMGGHAPSLLKWAMMLRRDDPQLQPVQDRVAVDLRGDIQVRWSEDAD
jgi:hypothetical protein